jgi:hypothetical protein
MAELVGIPKMLRSKSSTEPSNPNGFSTITDEAALWEFFCSAERLLCLVLNRTPITQRLESPQSKPLLLSGNVVVTNYLRRLTDITARFHLLDETEPSPGFGAQSYASSLELDKELRMLAQEVPLSWWDLSVEQSKPDKLLQLVHYYCMMRVHLPFTMRQAPNNGNVYSRLTCMEACEAVCERYQALRHVLPSGIFVSPILDLQGFTASVVLLLTSYNTTGDRQMGMPADKQKVHDTVARVVKVMDEKSRDITGATFAKHGAVSIRSLADFLHSGGSAGQKEVSLHVPLLGSITIRRNEQSSGRPPATQQMPSNNAGLWNNNFTRVSQSALPASMVTPSAIPVSVSTQQDWQWNPLSWSINDQDNFFQEALPMDMLDQFGGWNGGFDMASMSM